MSREKVETSHFLHITRRKYKRQYKRLRKLYRHSSYLVKPNEVLKDRQLTKYWRNRRSIFSKINSSPIYLTHELWFSVTPEIIAKFLAKFIRACLPNATKIMDVFCGGGGNAIQFAMVFPKVYGVDASLEHLYCSYRNAQTYGVSDRIWLKYGSWEDIARKGRFAKLGIDCIFGSPPWGGPGYLKSETYDLEMGLQPMGLTEMLKSFLSVSSNVVLFLPRNSDLNQLSRATRIILGPNSRCRVLYVKDHGYLKGILCMWGDALVYAQGEASENNEDTDTTPNVTEVTEPQTELKSNKEEIPPESINYDMDG